MFYANFLSLLKKDQLYKYFFFIMSVRKNEPRFEFWPIRKQYFKIWILFHDKKKILLNLALLFIDYEQNQKMSILRSRKKRIFLTFTLHFRLKLISNLSKINCRFIKRPMHTNWLSIIAECSKRLTIKTMSMQNRPTRMPHSSA